MKTFYINNSCYSSTNNKYKRRSKPQDLQSTPHAFMRNLLFETQYHISNKLNSSLLTPSSSNIPTNAFSTFSPKNKSTSSFSSLPSLSPHSPSSISLHYKGYNHDSSLIFTNTINPLHKKRIHISPHQIKHNITTLQMPDDMYGKKIIDVIYNYVNKNTYNKIKCNAKHKELRLYNKIINAVIGHCVEYRNRNNKEMGKDVIEEIYENEMKKLRNAHGDEYNESNEHSIVSSIIENEGSKDDISLINERSSELETSFDKGISHISNININNIEKNDNNNNDKDNDIKGKITLKDIKHIKERIRQCGGGLELGYGFGFGLTGRLNSTHNIFNIKNITSTNKNYSLLHNIIFNKKHIISNQNIPSHCNNTVINNITQYHKTKLKPQIILNDNCIRCNDMKKNVFSTKNELHRNILIGKDVYDVNTQTISHEDKEDDNEKLYSKKKEKCSLDEDNGNGIIMYNRNMFKNGGNMNTKLKEYRKLVVHNRNEGNGNDMQYRNVSMGLSNQNEQSTKEETSAAFFKIKGRDIKREENAINNNNINKNFCNNNIIISNSNGNNNNNGKSNNNNEIDNINGFNNSIKIHDNNKRKSIRLESKKLSIKVKPKDINVKKRRTSQINNKSQRKKEHINDNNNKNNNINEIKNTQEQITDEKLRNSFYNDPLLPLDPISNYLPPKKAKKRKIPFLKPIQLRHCKTSYYPYISKNIFLKQKIFKSSLHKHLQLSNPSLSSFRANSAHFPYKYISKFKKLKKGLSHSTSFPHDYLSYSLSSDSLITSSTSSLLSHSSHQSLHNENEQQSSSTLLQLRHFSNKKGKQAKDFFNMKSKFVNYRRSRMYGTLKRKSVSFGKNENVKKEEKEEKTHLQRFIEIINKAKDQGMEVYIKELTEFFDGEFEASDIYKSKLLEERMNKFKAELKCRVDMKKEFKENIEKGIQFKDVVMFNNKHIN